MVSNQENCVITKDLGEEKQNKSLGPLASSSKTCCNISTSLSSLAISPPQDAAGSLTFSQAWRSMPEPTSPLPLHSSVQAPFSPPHTTSTLGKLVLYRIESTAIAIKKRSEEEKKGQRNENKANSSKIPLDRKSLKISKVSEKPSRTLIKSHDFYDILWDVQKNRPRHRLLDRHLEILEIAIAQEKRREILGLPKSRRRIPSYDDKDSVHREFYVKNIESIKVDKEVVDGFIERVDHRHHIQLDDLDPELLTGKPLTALEKVWVKRKQARRQGPPSSSWPTNVPLHDQYTEYIRLTDKARIRFDKISICCSECGSKLCGTSILFPLSQPANEYPFNNIIDPKSPICVGCARLFSCVYSFKEKMELITWIVRGKTDHRILEGKPHYNTLYNICRYRMLGMADRAEIHFRRLPKNFVSTTELCDAVLRDNYNCYLVGSPMTIKSSRYNSLTFDHVFPISTSMDMPNCWSINNLKPMSFCMNQVKRNETNKEVKRWLLNFIKHYSEQASNV